MRSLLVALVALAPACVPGLDDLPAAPAPLLEVTSPQRSLIEPQAGQLVVTGTVTPIVGTPIKSVTVNKVQATVNADGTFQAMIDVPPGASLIHTVVTDQAGGIATDTRSVEAGQLMPPGSNIPSAVGASISANTFSQIAGVAAGQLSSANLTTLAKGLNPVIHAGDPMGPDCLYGEAYVDNITVTGAKLSLVPTTAGLQIGAELDGVDVTGHANFAVACVKGSSNFSLTASSATLGGTLALTVNGMNGFAASLGNADVNLTNLQVSASGIPQAVLNILPIEKIVNTLAPTLVPQLVNPMLNQGLGALTAPQKVMLLGKTIDIQVAPSAISFDANAATVMLDMKMLIEGTENSPGFTFTPNGMPALDAGNGLAIALADDLANEALSELTSTGLLNLSLPTGGATVQLEATSPPMISADPDGSGTLRLILPDMNMSLPAGKAVINAQVDVSIGPGSDASTVSINLGTPSVAIDVLGDAGPSDFVKAANDGTGNQVGSIGQLLQNIPLPQVDGFKLTDTSVAGSNGYILVKTTLQ